MLVRGKRNIIILCVFIFLFAILSISIGMYFRWLSKPSHIVGEVLSHISEKNVRYFFPNQDVYVGDQFTLESSIDFDLESDYYKSKSLEDVDSLKKYNLLKNLSLLDTKFVMKHDSNNRQLFIELQQKLGEESIQYKKELVDNETHYYYVDGILNQYVNNGTCHYFETIKGDSTTKDNFQYLYQYFFTALKNSLLDEEIKEYEVMTNIQSKEQKVHQISMRFTNKNIIKIWNSIINNYEKNDKAIFLLQNIIPNYKDYLLKEDSSILSNNEYYLLNIYTTRFFYVPLKYEIIHMNGDEKEVYIYEGDSSSGEFYYLLNDQVQYVIDMEWRNTSILFKVKNNKGEELGDLRFDRDGNNITANFSFEEKDNKYEIIYASKYDSVKKGKSNERTDSLSFVIVQDKISKLNGTIQYTKKYDNKVVIEESVGEAILASKLTKEQKDLFKNKNRSVKERLEG